MVDINIITNSKIPTTFPPKASFKDPEPNKPTALSTIIAPDGIKISGEAQYLMEMDFYLQSLDQEEQNSAINFLSKSNDPLHAKAIETFNDSQKNRMSVEEQKSITEARELFTSTTLRAKWRDPTLGPEVALIPAGTNVFRLDGKKDSQPTQMNTFNTKARDEVDALESATPANLNIQEKANVFGTVRNALYASDTIQLSFDDVLNFNYMLEKARTTINETNAPDDFKSKLNDILDQSVKYQNTKQTNFLVEIKKYVTNDRVGADARENIRLGTAAQAYNKDFQGILKGTGISVLDASPLMTNLLSKHTDLIRFSQDKITEALSFYKKDFDTYQDFVKNGYTPDVSNVIIYDTAPLTEGHNYALKVIEEIQSYVLKSK